MTQSSFHDTMIALPNFSMDSPASLAMADRMNGLFAPLSISADKFAEAYDLAIGEHVDKNYKGLSYLSWPFAFRYLKQQFPAYYVAFEESTMGWPVFGQIGCWLLRPYLTDGCSRTPALVFPLMDNKHNALKELDARAVSDNIQRASVKCIATFTGLGLKLYSGEDIPKSDDKETTPRIAVQQETTKPAKVQKPVPTPAAASVPRLAPSKCRRGSEVSCFIESLQFFVMCGSRVYAILLAFHKKPRSISQRIRRPMHTQRI